MSEKPILEVIEVSKSFQANPIVEKISFDLSAGEVMVLAGPNGAGKSTILQMIIGLLQPNTGHIRMNGFSWRQNRTDYVKQFGYMPDHFQFSNAFTARETLLFWAGLLGVHADRVDQLLEQFDLQKYQKQSPTTFSKGMQQRLLFAQALLAKPPLFILDEPTNGLDPEWRKTFVEWILQLKQAGHAILFTTHQMDVATQVADHILYLENKTISRDATLSPHTLN